ITPIVAGKLMISFPFLSAILILVTLPSAINSLIFRRRFSPVTVNVSLNDMAFVFIFVPIYLTAKIKINLNSTIYFLGRHLVILGKSHACFGDPSLQKALCIWRRLSFF